MKENKNIGLLEYAKANYPIGTKFRSSLSGSIFTVITHEIEVHGDGDVQLRNQGLNCPFLYRNNTWAEIISSPKPIINNQIIDNYEIY